MSTEKTPLVVPIQSFGSTPDIPRYPHETYRYYSRRRRERQLQCITFVTVFTAFIMALIVTISYSVNHPDILPPVTNVSEVSEIEFSSPVPNLKLFAPNSNLTEEEIVKGKEAGRAALLARWQADTVTKPLPSPSPSSRHQWAVHTSPLANRIALAGVAEIAATQEIEKSRSFLGQPSSIGSYFDGEWIPEVVCPRGKNIVCPTVPTKYRRFDGACNHPENLGMAYSPFKRSLPADYADGIAAPRVGKYGNVLPSARLVRRKVHPPASSINPSFTVMLAVFGQFLDHDITATADSRGRLGNSLSCCDSSVESSHPECFNVKVGPGDPVYDAGGLSCMEFVRSAPAAQCKIGPRQQLNQVTSFIDGSTIYGADVDTVDALREFSGGRLRMQSTPDNRELLPVSENPNDGCNRQTESEHGRYCFASGDKRANENLHLTTMHLLWARQHNRLAGQLAEINPHWDDETLFQESRRIIGAQLQHITYREMLPIMLGKEETKKRNLEPLATGFRAKNNSDVDPSIANHFSAAAFRFAHTLLPGLIKMTNNEMGSSSWVQLHKLLFNPYSLYNEGGVESSITSATSNAIQKTSTHVTSQLTEHLFEDPMGNETKVGCGLDLVSLNIQRGRDHGLPGYVKWREYCGLQKPLKFADLTDDMDPESFDAISKLYDNVDDVDLYTGALAEIPKGDGLVGPTFTCLIAAQFERLQSGDKYWYETADQPGSFTEDQLQELRKTSLAGIICDTSIGITEVQAHVMRSVGPDNPITSCEDIPKPSLASWKSDIPLLVLSANQVPVDNWLKFKDDVNQTITEIIANITALKPPPGSLPADWLAFQQKMNVSFSDLRKKFSTLHPKVITNSTLNENTVADINSFDWEGLKGQVNSTVQEIMDYIYANKPAPNSLPTDWLVYRKKINDSLTDFRKKFKIFDAKNAENRTPPSLKEVGNMPAIDWTQIRSDINKTITDVVNVIKGSKPMPASTPDDWLAFRQRINDALSGIKNKFKGLHPKSATPIEKLEGLGNRTTVDYVALRNGLKSSLKEIIESKELPIYNIPVDWDWDAFRGDVNNTLDELNGEFTVLNNKTSGNNDNDKAKSKNDKNLPSVPQGNSENNVNKTIEEIVAEIKASKPAAGSPQEDWVAYSQKLVKAFADIKNKSSDATLEKKFKTKVKLSGTAADLNKTLDDLLDVIQSKKPTPDSPPGDWLAYRQEIKDSVSKIKDQFAVIKTAELDEPQLIKENDATFNWAEWKNQINKTIDGLIAEVKTMPSADSKWASFGKSLNKTFMDLKNNIATMREHPPLVRLMQILVTDLTTFKDDIHSTIEETLTNIKSNLPPAGDVELLNYNTYVKNLLVKAGEDVDVINTEWLQKMKMATDVMTVTGPLQEPVTDSASSFRSKFQLEIGIVFVCAVLSVG